MLILNIWRPSISERTGPIFFMITTHTVGHDQSDFIFATA